MSETVVITGASAGIGRAAAERFGSRGDRVALIARGEDGLRGAADAVEYLGGRALPLPADVADFEAVNRAAETTETAGSAVTRLFDSLRNAVRGPARPAGPAERDGQPPDDRSATP